MADTYKGPPVRGREGLHVPVKGTEGPATGTGLIAPFPLTLGSGLGEVKRVT